MSAFPGLHLLERQIAEEKTKESNLLNTPIDDYQSIFYQSKIQTELLAIISHMEHSHATILALMINSGADIINGRCRITDLINERKKDFMKLMELSLNEYDYFISFESIYDNKEMCCAIFEKSPEITLKWLSEAVSYMNL